MSLNLISQKEYLKKYLSGDVKKKKKKKITGGTLKRSIIVDDDIDLKSMRPLEDDEVDLYQMDEDAPLIAGIVDERPVEVKAQEYYSSKRWKVFGGEDGVNVIDSMNKEKHGGGEASKTLKSVDVTDSPSEEENSFTKKKPDKDINKINLDKEVFKNKKIASRDDFDSSPKDNKPNVKQVSSSFRQHSKQNYNESGSDKSKKRIEKGKPLHYADDSDVSPPRRQYKNSSSNSDASPPRKKSQKTYQRDSNDSDESLPRRKDSTRKSPKASTKYLEKDRRNIRSRSYSNSPPRSDKTKRQRYKCGSDNSPPRREKHSYKKDKSDSDASPPHKNDKHKKHVNGSPLRREKRSYSRGKSDSDASPPRRTEKYPGDYKSRGKARRGPFSNSNNSPPRKERRNSPKTDFGRRRSSRSRTPPESNSFSKSRKLHREKSPRLSRIDKNEKTFKRRGSDSDNSPQRRREKSNGSDSDMSLPRKKSSYPVNDRPLKKVFYKPNDSSSDEGPRSKSKKMKTTLDGKQAGLQDAKQLKKELSDLKMKEDTIFSKMDASVSGVGAAPVKRDRKTGQIRDFEKEKEVQREKKAKESVVNEKYYKWGKGVKQTEDAAVRAAEAVKEMNKPLARYVDDKDLDELLKAQEREGDPMLDYIKQKQSESTPLQGEKPIYKGSWNPNRFNIRPGYRWDGVVRSNGYEQEWFKTKNAKKARDEEAYKWSTSDM